MSRLFLNNLLYLHSPSTVGSNRGYSSHVYQSAVLVDGVPMEVIILANAANGPLLPDGSRVRAVGRAVRVGEVVLVKDPALTVITDDNVGQQASLIAPMRDLAISGDSETRDPANVGDAKDTVRVADLGPLAGPLVERLEVVEITDEAVVNNEVHDCEVIVIP